MKNFTITQGKGFTITFANGWLVSIQFGPEDMCDNDDIDFEGSYLDMCKFAGDRGSPNAQCMVLNPSGNHVCLPIYKERRNVVSNRSDPAEVLMLINWAASQEPKS